MLSSGKIVDRKRDIRNLSESDDLRQAAESKASSIVEIDLSFNQIE